jgi:MFS family permease
LARNGDGAAQTWPGGWRPWGLLAALLAAYVLAFVDRQVLNLLVEPIKRDLHLSDTQVSLLQGLAFALFLSAAGLPVGRLVDKRRRITLIALGVGFWSLATAACGLVRGYPQLLAARIGVAVGESVTPGAYSLIGDLFPPRRMGLAISLYQAGPYLGGGLALIGGAWLIAHTAGWSLGLPLFGELHGWRLVFLLIGLPGLLVALLVACLKEPARTGPSRAAAPSPREVGRYFRANAGAILGLNLCTAAAATMSYGFSAWAPSFLIRTFHMTPPQVGAAYGPIVILAGVAGSLSAGIAGDWAVARGFRVGRLGVMVAAVLCALPCATAAALAGSAGAALMLIAPTGYFTAVALAGAPAALQDITPPRMRGVQHALGILAVNLVGLGSGPTAVALVTDFVLHDEGRLRYALATVAPAALAFSALFGALAAPAYSSSRRRMVADSA